MAAVAAALHAGALPAAGQSSQALLDSLLAGNVHPLRVEADARLTGPGAVVLQQAARGAHFVAVGENHNTRAIPELTVALFRMLHEREGFDYLALEEGPEIGRRLSRAVRGGQADGAFRLGLRYPSAFHMYTEEELRMIDRVAAISAARADPVWGLNQEFAAAHVLERLVELAPDAEARSLAQEQHRRALEYEAERYVLNTSYLSAVASPADFQALRQAFRPALGSEADDLIHQLALSHEVWAPYNASPQAPFTAFHASGLLREQNMKTLFARFYRQAQARDGRPPRVLVKSGHVHLNRGIGPNNEVFTLGNFLSELATFQGGHSLHLYVVLNWPDLPESFLAPFGPHLTPGQDVLFDLRPLQPWAAQARIPGLDPRLRRVLMGYDVLIVLSDTTRGSVQALRTPRFRQYPSGS
jgi:erythromycin esterase-like protein